MRSRLRDKPKVVVREIADFAISVPKAFCEGLLL